MALDCDDAFTHISFIYSTRRVDGGTYRLNADPVKDHGTLKRYRRQVFNSNFMSIWFLV